LATGSETAVAADPVYRPAGDVVMRRIADEAVLVPVRSNVGDLDSIFTLNQTAITIWSALDGNTPLHQVIDCVCAEYEVDRETASADTLEILAQLAEVGLIEEAE
jgi:hypothetical protein